MGTSLNGLTPAGTYPGLIKTGDNAPIDGTLKTLSDGNGNNLPMSVSTTTINLTGTAQVGGVAIANTTQLAAKQDTLVSGTNIKTINGTSVLGSGDIVTPQPSGVSGAIQFSNGSAFASDATNLFWDDTNNRLGIGTNAPSATGHFKGSGSSGTTTALLVQNSVGTEYFAVQDNGTVRIANNQAFRNGASNGVNYFDMGNIIVRNGDTQQGGSISIGTGTAATAKLQIMGSGSTSATTSLLVQNSAGTAAMTVKDDLSATFGGTVQGGNLVATANINFGNILYGTAFWNQADGGTKLGASSAPVASALLEMVSTTKGFLPPRMTTTQKNAIATPASGLVVYDTTTNKLCCYNGSTWNDLF